MMQHEDGDQKLVAEVLASRPPDEVPADFVARVNLRIDALGAPGNGGWFALADFRAWTLRLVPIAGVLVLLGLLWPVSSSTTSENAVAVSTQAQPSQAQAFTPASPSDWQRDVTANALLEAALRREGNPGAR